MLIEDGVMRNITVSSLGYGLGNESNRLIDGISSVCTEASSHMQA